MNAAVPNLMLLLSPYAVARFWQSGRAVYVHFMRGCGSCLLPPVTPAAVKISQSLPAFGRDHTEGDLLVTHASGKRGSKASFGRSRLGLSGREKSAPSKSRPNPGGQRKGKSQAEAVALEPKPVIPGSQATLTLPEPGGLVANGEHGGATNGADATNGAEDSHWHSVRVNGVTSATAPPPPAIANNFNAPTPRLRYSKGYIADQLAAGERKRYKAAGVLLYQFMGPKDELHVLMGRLDQLAESRFRRGTYRQKKNACYSFLGGKENCEIDQSDPQRTALRELTEETGGLLSPTNFPGPKPLPHVLWYPPGRYALYIREVKGLEHVPSLYEAEGRPGDSQDLKWFPISEISSVIKGRITRGVLRHYCCGVFMRTALEAWLLGQQSLHLKHAASSSEARPIASLNITPTLIDSPCLHQAGTASSASQLVSELMWAEELSPRSPLPGTGPLLPSTTTIVHKKAISLQDGISDQQHQQAGTAMGASQTSQPNHTTSRASAAATASEPNHAALMRSSQESTSALQQAASPHQADGNGLQGALVSPGISMADGDGPANASQKGRKQSDGTPSLLKRPSRDAAMNLAAALLTGSTQDRGSRESTADSSSEQVGAESLMQDLVAGTAQDSVGDDPEPTQAPELTTAHPDSMACMTSTPQNRHAESGSAVSDPDRHIVPKEMSVAPSGGSDNSLSSEDPSSGLPSSSDEMAAHVQDEQASASDVPQQPGVENAGKDSPPAGGLLGNAAEPFGMEPPWWSRNRESDQRERAASGSPDQQGAASDSSQPAPADAGPAEMDKRQESSGQQGGEPEGVTPVAEPAQIDGSPQVSHAARPESTTSASSSAEAALADQAAQTHEADQPGLSQAERQLRQQASEAANWELPTEGTKAKTAVMAQLRNMVVNLLHRHEVIIQRQVEAHNIGQAKWAACPQQPVDPVTDRSAWEVSVADIMRQHRSMPALRPQNNKVLPIRSRPSPGAKGRGWSRQEWDMLVRRSIDLELWQQSTSWVRDREMVQQDQQQSNDPHVARARVVEDWLQRQQGVQKERAFSKRPTSASFPIPRAPAYLLPPHTTTASCSETTRAIYAARLKAHALQSIWLLSAVDWKRFGGAYISVFQTFPASQDPASLPQPIGRSQPDTLADGPALASNVAAAAAPTSEALVSREVAAWLRQISGRSALKELGELLIMSQSIAKHWTMSEQRWTQCPCTMMDFRLPKGARLHGQPSNNVDGIAALRGGPLGDPRSSLFHMLHRQPERVVLWCIKLLSQMSMSVSEVAVTATNKRGRQKTFSLKPNKQ
ncbi:hypothetical protein WJX74_007353 [Apatococcus lobatus]|uniref:Nudix hydrolase domain-containing protein n=1 Tax=Apatococcus lobatus TaxID=904363 RepID=A0AAW1RM11_9CHLO